MRYWDASALVPLVVAEDTTAEVRQLLRADGDVVTWVWTIVEIVSAIERRAREGLITPRARRTALERFAQLAERWDEVVDVGAVRVRALDLLARHPLRAADAAQLAAALTVAGGRRLEFVCLDGRLSNAAEREGLHPLGVA